MESSNTLEQGANIPYQDKGAGNYAEHVALHHLVLLSFTKPKLHHWTVPCRGFLGGNTARSAARSLDSDP